MNEQNEKIEINLNDFDINKASFQLLLEVAARLRIITYDISVIKSAVINGPDYLQENINKEILQAIEDFKKAQYNLIAELMNKFDKEPDALNNIKASDDLTNLTNTVLVTVMEKLNSFLSTMENAIKHNTKADKNDEGV